MSLVAMSQVINHLAFIWDANIFFFDDDLWSRDCDRWQQVSIYEHHHSPGYSLPLMPICQRHVSNLSHLYHVQRAHASACQECLKPQFDCMATSLTMATPEQVIIGAIEEGWRGSHWVLDPGQTLMTTMRYKVKPLPVVAAAFWKFIGLLIIRQQSTAQGCTAPLYNMVQQYVA